MNRFKLIALGIFALIIGWLCLPVFPDDADEVSDILKDRNGEVLHIATTKDGYFRLPVELDAIDPAFVKALLEMEDRRFRSHIGVDPAAVLRAFKSNASAGRVVSGASTITMQLVRQYKPRPRTYGSKIIEAFEAVRLNLRVSKDEQLERYLTRISYGGNIQGVESASRIWLGKSARYLSTDEIALLLALPQAPEARRPDRNPVAAKAGRDLILDRMVKADLLSAEDRNVAASQHVQTVRHALPDQHFLALQSLGGGNSFLDSDLQTQVASILARHIETQPISVNAAAMVVHASSREVRALVGTGDQGHAGGWIDMTNRLRSPGSTLKPFIYGLARDDGALDMGTVMRDAPTRFGSYRPENFTRRYHGNVTVGDALAHSLNVPAVSALDAVGANRFRAALAAAGPQTKGQVGDMKGEGLALALGGTGLSARDLATLYTALANDGEAAPLRFTPYDEEMASYPFVSKDTARSLIDALRNAPRPKGLPNLPGIERIAYKTGTSYGFRDSWAVGIIGDYVIIVWTGRPDGAPRFGQTGRGSAAPILFDIAAPFIGDAARGYERKSASALSEFRTEQSKAPQILFPAHGSDVLANSRGLSITTEGEGAIRLYVDNRQIERQAGLAIWRPESPGFYRITAIDGKGRSANADIRIVSRDQVADAPF